MKHPELDTVTLENGPRPAGNPEECFYCQRPLGSPHKEECVIRLRTVVVRYTIEVPVAVPASWSIHDIEFQRGQGGWCMSNLIDDLKPVGCLCGAATAVVVREAEEHDEENWYVAGLRNPPVNYEV